MMNAKDCLPEFRQRVAKADKMESVIKIAPMRVGLTISGPRRLYDGKETKHQGFLFRSGSCSSFPPGHYSWEKREIKIQKTSVFDVTREDDRRHNSRADLARTDKSYETSKGGKKSLKQTDLAADKESVRIRDYGGAHQSQNHVRVDQTFSQAQRPDLHKEHPKPTRGPSSSWARLAGAECPLNPDEERSLSADVQDMLHLESQKDELKNKLGRPPTVEEWAGHSCTSVLKLYARWKIQKKQFIIALLGPGAAIAVHAHLDKFVMWQGFGRLGKGRAAKRKMIAANLSLVNSVAEQFQGRGLSHWELCQEGAQGLLRSAEKFDTSQNTKFSTYSFLWIWQRMSAGVKKFQHVLRISRTTYEASSILLQHKEDFEVLHGRPPSLQELADISQLDKDTIRNVMRILRPVKSMDESLSHLEDDNEEQIEDQNLGCLPWKHVMETELRTEVAKALECLTAREQTVVEMRYGLCGEPPQGRAQVGSALGLTYESIRLIEVLTRTKKGLDKLRHLAKEDGLQQYLSGGLWSQ